MRIMIVTAADSIHAVRWANAYAKREHEVYFIAINGHQERGDKFEKSIHQYYLHYGGMKGYILNAFELHKLWKKIGPDIVNVHYASGYGLLTRLSRIHPFVLSVWGSDVYDFPEKNLINRWLLVRNLKSADALASTSYAMADKVKELMGRPEQKMEITPFGVDVKKFSPQGEKIINKDNTFLFGTVKKLIYNYGIDTIIRAFNLFQIRWNEAGAVGPTPRLLICGKGENKSDFEKLRDRLGLHDDVDIRGYIKNEKIPSLLRSIDVFCLGSSKESFGVSAVEAMACGIPIIATETDGFKEVISEFETGYFVPIGNEEAMAEKMWALYQDKGQRIRFGENGRKRVLELYDWEKNVSIMETYLENTVLAWKGK